MKPKRINLLLILIAGLTALIFRSFQQPVSRDKLDRLKLGMTKEEVRQILGPATKEYPSGQWTYSRPLVFGFVNLHWDTDGKYPGRYNYERF